MIQSVILVARRNLAYGKVHLEDVEEAAMCRQPAGLVNHPAWIVGHVAGSFDLVLKTLGQTAQMPAAWGKLFGWGSTPTDDRAAYPPKRELMAAFESQHERVTAAVFQASPEALAAPLADEKLRQFMPTVGGLVCSLLTSHEAIHLGQLSAWRQAMGLPLRL